MSLSKSRFIELIGNIQNPKYPLVELNEICEFIKDGTHQTPIYTEDRVNGFKFLSSKDVTSQKINWTNIKYIPKELHEQLYAKLSPKRGDILLAKNGTTGVAAVVDSDEIFDIYVSLALLRPKSGVNVSYLCSALNSEDLKRQFNSSLKGIGVPNLHLREIKKARIIFPPIDIQNKISSITKQIDKSKFLLQKILEKLELLKKSRFIEMFGNPNTNSLNLPEKPIKNVCQNLDYKREPITSSERVKGKYPYYGASGIVDWVDNFIFDDDLLLVSEDGENLSARVTPIAFSIKGKTWVNNHAHVLKFNDLYMQNYVEYFFNQLDLTSKITGTAQPKFNQKALNETMLPIPSIESLVHFKNLCNQIDKSKLVIQKSLEDLVGKS